MTVARKPRALDWHSLAVAGLHPVKVSILEHLAENGNEPTSPNAFAQAFEKPLGVVSYHVRQLADPSVFAVPLLELHSTAPARGALQHFYVATPEAILSPRQAAARALQRSASRLAGAPVDLTGDALGRAFYAALAQNGGGESLWDHLTDRDRMGVRAAFEELLRGVAGA